MAGFRLSPRARKDLDEIWDFTSRRWDVDQAERYVREIERALDSLVARPGLGRPCDDIREGYRRFPSGSHVIFYRVRGQGVDVVRILHRSMDHGRHL